MASLSNTYLLFLLQRLLFFIHQCLIVILGLRIRFPPRGPLLLRRSRGSDCGMLCGGGSFNSGPFQACSVVILGAHARARGGGRCGTTSGDVEHDNNDADGGNDNGGRYERGIYMTSLAARCGSLLVEPSRLSSSAGRPSDGEMLPSLHPLRWRPAPRYLPTLPERFTIHKIQSSFRRASSTSDIAAIRAAVARASSSPFTPSSRIWR